MHASDGTTANTDELTPYRRWQAQQGIPVVETAAVADVMRVEVDDWPRLGARGSFVNLVGAEETNDAYVCELRPGVVTEPVRCLYEEFIYVLDGFGTTTIWNGLGRRHSFEWRRGSLFAAPLNTWRQHANLSTTETARFMAITSAPMVINLFGSEEFVFQNTHDFLDRFSGDEEQLGTGTERVGRIWETNFVPDVHTFKLKPWNERGGKGSNIMFRLRGNTMGAHVSEFGVGNYKKAHRHGPGAHLFPISGEGYSLMWKHGDAEKQKYPWGPGSLVCPPGHAYHQHFNVGAEPARYLAIHWGKMPLAHSYNTKIKTPGLRDQIEYEDEDPDVYEMFEAELRKRGREPDPAQPRSRALVPNRHEEA
jgi:gentisate 1,2-dioxygenase